MTMDLSSLKPDQLRAINNIIGRLSYASRSKIRCVRWQWRLVLLSTNY